MRVGDRIVRTAKFPRFHVVAGCVVCFALTTYVSPVVVWWVLLLRGLYKAADVTVECSCIKTPI